MRLEEKYEQQYKIAPISLKIMVKCLSRMAPNGVSRMAPGELIASTSDLFSPFRPVARKSENR